MSRLTTAGWTAASTPARVRVVVYAVAALAGLVLTTRFNLQFSDARGGFDVGDYVRAGFANSASTSFTIDILVAALAGVLFMLVEGRRLRMRSAVPLVIATFVLAFAFAFPAFLALRELRLAHRGDQPAG